MTDAVSAASTTQPEQAATTSTPKGADTGRRSRGTVWMLGRLMPFLRPYRGRIVLATLALVVAAAATLTVPMAFRQLIDLGFVAQDAATGGATVNRYFLALFGVAVVLGMGTAVRFYFVSWLGERVTADLRSAIYAHVLKQDPTFFETLKAGEVLSRLTADTTLVQTLIGTSVSMGLRNALLFVGALGLMVYTSPTLASSIVGLVLLVVAPILVLGRRVRRLSRASQDRIADSSALAGERLNAIQTVQAFAREAFEAGQFEQITETAFSAAIRRIRARSTLTAIAIVLVFGAIVFVLWMGAHAVIQGRMTGGTLTQFILYSTIMAGATGALSEVLGDIQRAAGAMERLMELLSVRSAIAVTPAVSERAAAPDVLHPQASVAGSALSLREVVFSYPSRPAERAIDAVTLDVHPGETVALVGPPPT